MGSLALGAGCSGGDSSDEAAPEPIPEESTTTTQATTTTTTAPPTTTLGPADCVARAPLFQVVGQLVLATATQDQVRDVVIEIGRGQLGGLVLLEDADRGVVDELRVLSEVVPPPVIAVDEEGGDVQRLAAILGNQPSARSLAESETPEITRAVGAARGAGAGQLGFTMVLAPVLDVGSSAGSDSRAYGDDAETVIDHGLAYAEGLASSGVVPVAKHFPGHGSADGDSHRTLPSTPDLVTMRQVDLVPFEAAVGVLPAIMIGHLVVPGLTDELPATVSPDALDLLRDDLGFDGLVVSDDLSMRALEQWSVAEAAELAVAAGIDLLIAGGRDDAIASADRLAAAVAAGRLDRERVDEAAGRVLESKGLDACEVWFVGTG